MCNQIRTNMMMNPMNDLSRDEFLIVALDFDNAVESLELIKKIPSVKFFKVGMELFYSEGPEIIRSIKNLGKKIFLDLKINDIPKTIEKTVKKLSSYDVDYLPPSSSPSPPLSSFPPSSFPLPTVFCDEAGIEAAREGVGTNKTRILNVTVLTSQISSPEIVLARARMSFSAGAHGIICSGLETREIRDKIQNNNFIIVNPGIRLSPGGDDQVRTVTPIDAKAAGATNIVVGRPITQSTQPHLVAQAIIDSCRSI